MNQLARGALLTVLMMFVAAACRAEQSFEVKHGFADSNGVKIHYAESGTGPLVVMIHGFPDFWYGWREQMQGLADGYHVVAIDQRGYNLSDKPEGVENYRMENLLADINAIIDDLGVSKVNLVGHDWGGAIAWQFAMAHPDKVERLIILNLTHP